MSEFDSSRPVSATPNAKAKLYDRDNNPVEGADAVMVTTDPKWGAQTTVMWEGVSYYYDPTRSKDEGVPVYVDIG